MVKKKPCDAEKHQLIQMVTGAPRLFLQIPGNLLPEERNRPFG
jgi:hypothetical protein